MVDNPPHSDILINMKYTILYKKHGENTYNRIRLWTKREAVGFKDRLIHSYRYSDIRILFNKDGMSNCVFHATNLVDLYNYGESVNA